MATKGIHGRSSPYSGSEDTIICTRLKPNDDGGSFTVASTAFDHDVATSNDFFRSEDPVDTATFDAVKGYDGGYRHYMRIFSDNDFFIKFGSTSDKSHKILAANTPFELVNREFKNIYLRSATATTPQVQHVHTVADSSGSLNNTYFYLYASNATTGYDEVLGVWFNVSSGGTQPTDALVTQWIAVAIATNDTAATVGTATEAAIEAIAVPAGGTDAFTSSVATADITITHNAAFSGAQGNAADSTAAATGFTFDAPTTEGDGAALAIDLLMI